MASRGITVTYRLGCDSEAEATDLARAIAREQTVEVPPGVGGDALQARVIGKVLGVAPAPRQNAGRFHVRIGYPLEATGTELTQILNVVYGNVSLMGGVRVVDLDLSPAVLDALPGPRFGVGGIRTLVGAATRPMVCAAIKPLGLSPAELAGLAAAFARAGVDFVKDDHGLAEQPAAPFAERVEVVADAVAEANAATGGHAQYLPNVTGALDTLEERLEGAVAAGLAGLLISPGLAGMDAVRWIAEGPRELAVMAHPAFAQTAPGRGEGIAPEVLLGTLHRVAGADMVIYPNVGGRFGWTEDVCLAINRRLRQPLGRIRGRPGRTRGRSSQLAAVQAAPAAVQAAPAAVQATFRRPPGHIRRALPTPAGGMKVADAADCFARYGPDTVLLIGGSLLMQKDLEGAARRLVEAAAEAGEVGGPRSAEGAEGAEGVDSGEPSQ
ncbi:MAG: RuBisCO large subunit C-terminal-like domain-containing protein [Gemmatimonadota bacterium]|nr:RuBisCO large subunit C-terminal-like domain-containing protein [Gemmatimonadota bacterium]